MKTIYRLEVGESVLIHTAEWFNINTYIIDHRRNTRSFTIDGYNLIVPEMFKYFGKIAKISRITYNTDIEEFMYYIEGCDFLWDIRCFDINTPMLVNNSIANYCSNYCIQECSKDCPLFSTISFIKKHITNKK